MHRRLGASARVCRFWACVFSVSMAAMRGSAVESAVWAMWRLVCVAGQPVYVTVLRVYVAVLLVYSAVPLVSVFVARVSAR